MSTFHIPFLRQSCLVNFFLYIYFLSKYNFWVFILSGKYCILSTKEYALLEANLGNFLPMHLVLKNYTMFIKYKIILKIEGILFTLALSKGSEFFGLDMKY